MIGKMASDQGRARGLYDEQLQRKQQEKSLPRVRIVEDKPALFRRDRPAETAREA
jgi:hypothetical protein